MPPRDDDITFTEGLSREVLIIDLLKVAPGCIHTATCIGGNHSMQCKEYQRIMQQLRDG